MAGDAETEDGSLWPPGVEPTADFLSTLDFVRNSRGNLFVTGRAGTGKSTLLRAIVRALGDEVVIGAPTGIAAFNVGGQTLHSLFRLPREGLLLDGEETRFRSAQRLRDRGTDPRRRRSLHGARPTC